MKLWEVSKTQKAQIFMLNVIANSSQYQFICGLFGIRD